MSNAIFDIDDHIGLVPNGYSEQDACKYFTQILLWANCYNYLTSDKKLANLISMGIEKFKSGQISATKFIVEMLEGELSTDYFQEDICEFVYDYVTTGILSEQITKFYK